jgi:hypothetical protein
MPLKPTMSIGSERLKSPANWAWGPNKWGGRRPPGRAGANCRPVDGAAVRHADFFAQGNEGRQRLGDFFIAYQA